MDVIGAIFRALVEGLFRALFELLFHSTGNLLIWMLSLGRLRGAPVFPNFGEFHPFFGGRARNGQFVVGWFVAMMIGMIVWLIAFMILVTWLKQAQVGSVQE